MQVSNFFVWIFLKVQNVVVIRFGAQKGSELRKVPSKHGV